MEEPVLADGAPTDKDHNARALVLRNGLAIVLFASLEQFLRARAAEVAAAIARAGIGFGDLPEGLRDACTYGALKGLTYQSELRRRQGEDATAFIQAHAQKISTLTSGSFIVSELSLGWDKPNLGHDDVRQMLTSFLVKDGWSQMRLLAARAGISSPSLQSSFRNAATRRHQAAHRGDANALLTDLQASLADSTAIALSFDSLISRAASKIAKRDTDFLQGASGLSANDIRLRFLRMETPTTLREFEEGKTKALKRHRTLESARKSAEASARVHGEVVVIVNKRGIPEDWLTTDV